MTSSKGGWSLLGRLLTGAGRNRSIEDGFARSQEDRDEYIEGIVSKVNVSARSTA